jgi:hypothetical protein
LGSIWQSQFLKETLYEVTGGRFRVLWVLTNIPNMSNFNSTLGFCQRSQLNNDILYQVTRGRFWVFWVLINIPNLSNFNPNFCFYWRLQFHKETIYQVTDWKKWILWALGVGQILAYFHIELYCGKFNLTLEQDRSKGFRKYFSHTFASIPRDT